MKKVKVSEAAGPVLDWMVAKIEKVRLTQASWEYLLKTYGDQCIRIGGPGTPYSPSSDWSQGGPLIEREKIELRHDGRQSWCAWIAKTGAVHGPTPLIAACRCFVSSKFSDEVEVPEELL